MLDFLILTSPSSPHLSSAQRDNLVLSLAQMHHYLKCFWIWWAHTSKSPGAYFLVFCPLRLAASDVAVFPVNKLFFVVPQIPAKHYLPEGWRRWTAMLSLARGNSEKSLCIRVLSIAFLRCWSVMLTTAKLHPSLPGKRHPQYVQLLAFETSNFSSRVWWCYPVMC